MLEVVCGDNNGGTCCSPHFIVPVKAWMALWAWSWDRTGHITSKPTLFAVCSLWCIVLCCCFVLCCVVVVLCVVSFQCCMCIVLCVVNCTLCSVLCYVYCVYCCIHWAAASLVPIQPGLLVNVRENLDLNYRWEFNGQDFNYLVTANETGYLSKLWTHCFHPRIMLIYLLPPPNLIRSLWVWQENGASFCNTHVVWLAHINEYSCMNSILIGWWPCFIFSCMFAGMTSSIQMWPHWLDCFTGMHTVSMIFALPMMVC